MGHSGRPLNGSNGGPNAAPEAEVAMTLALTVAQWLSGNPLLLALNSFEVKTCDPHIEVFSGHTALAKRGMVMICALGGGIHVNAPKNCSAQQNDFSHICDK